MITGQTAKQIEFLQNEIIELFTGIMIEYNKHFFVTHNIVVGYSSLITK